MNRLAPVLAALFFAALALAAEKPNVVLIFMDDMGYADIGSYGAQGYETPQLDQLARDGLRFTSFYVAQAVCSASRTALQTGAFPNRVGILGALGPNATHGIADGETTLGELLKGRGYATCAVGKWHMGHHPQFLPTRHGYDEYLGLPYSNDMWPVNFDGKPHEGRKSGYPTLPLIDGEKPVVTIATLRDQDTLTTRYTERAVSFIERNRERPFFLYFAHSMVHVPLGVSEKFRGKSGKGLFGDVMMEVDWSVGQVLGALERAGVASNTLVIYTSDNGPWLNFGNHAGSADPLREGKGGMWEGGCRVPCLMRWPGRIQAGRVTDAIAATVDVLPTLAEITGAPLPAHKLDGVSQLPLLLDPAAPAPRTSYAFYYGEQLQFYREGKWKLSFPHGYRSYRGQKPGADGWPGPTAERKAGWELFDLEADVGEARDLAAEQPAVVERLKAAGQAYDAELRANRRPAGRLPTPPAT